MELKQELMEKLRVLVLEYSLTPSIRVSPNEVIVFYHIYSEGIQNNYLIFRINYA